jgi:peptidoglycan/xylan/chitin deacetylase (PgdA/CDA1 family)
MAVLRARALAVAAGVPATFALLAAVLTVGSPGPAAIAAEPPAAAQPVGVFAVYRQPGRMKTPKVDVSFRITTSDPVVFLTIDDGVHKDRRALRYVESSRLPVTAFLSTWTIKESAPYFTRITRWGSIQNHSATHASMARPATDLDHEICYSQRALRADFGAEPWMLRPPYGDGYDRTTVQMKAIRCGISRIVMWDAVVERGTVVQSGSRLRPGSIVLLHFSPGLEKDLKAAVRAARRAGLRPASLADYLPNPY